MAIVADFRSRIVDFHSQSSSLVPGNHVGGASQDDCQLLQNTVAFEEDDGFDNRVVHLESPGIDTELVDDLDSSENLTIPTFEYEDDVVLDSEDEGIDGSRVIRVSSALSRSEAVQKVGSDAQEENVAADFHYSDQKQCDTGEQVSSNCVNGFDMGKDSSQPSARLSYCSSQEPGESTQVNALGFVDHFLSVSTANANPSQGICHRKAARVQSPLLSRIKGPQNLAKRIGRKSIEETGSFEWVDIQYQEAECNLFGECQRETSDFGNCRRQSYATKPQNIAKLGNKDGDRLLEKYEDEEMQAYASAGIQFQVDSTASTLPHPKLDICSLETYGMDNIEIENKSNKESNEKLAEEPFGSKDDEEDALDQLDIGFSTQIAAEAMEALSYIPDSNKTINACSPQNALENVPCYMIEDKPHLKNSYPQKIGGIVRKSKRTLQSKRKFNAKCLNTYEAQYDCQKLESVLINKRKAKRGRLAVQGKLSYRNSPDGSNYSATSSNLLSYTGSCQLSQQGPTNGNQVPITGMMHGIWSHPRRRRTPRNLHSHPNESSNQNNTFLAVDGRCSNSILMKNGTKAQKNQEMKKPISILSSYPHRQSFIYNSDRYLADQVYDKSNSAGRNFLRKKTSRRSSSRNDDYHKTTIDKILPKSSSKELARLGVSESMPDLRWKDLRRRRTMALVKVCFSQHLDEITIKQQKKVALQLGISIASSSADATHFVADKFVRTRNMLEAIALGKPVVTHSWLESCGQASCFIDEKNYILRDTKKEKEIGFNLPVSLSRATQRPLLKGLRVLVTPNIRPDKEIITSLVKMSQGEPVERSQIFTGKDEQIPDDLLILSCEEDYENCVPFLRKGVRVYSLELLLNGIVIQKLEHKRYELFIERWIGFVTAKTNREV